MLIVKDQICCYFSIGNVADFIDDTNLNYMYIFENAGNVRPIIKMQFRLDDANVINYINAGNPLVVAFGVNQIEDNISTFEIFNENIVKTGNHGYVVTLSAALLLPKFTSAVGCAVYGNLTSLEVIQNIVKNNGFTLNTNITKTDDQMVWQRIGDTEWKFMRDIWLHSYVDDTTFTAFGFDSNSMYFYDVKNLVSGDAKWLFTSKYWDKPGSPMVTIGSYFTEDNHGVLAPLIGQNLNNKTFNSDTGEYVDDKYNLKTFTSIDTDCINLNTANKINYNYNVINNDYHKNYVKAYNQNLRNNILYSTFSIYTTTAGAYKKFKLLDTVMFDVYPADSRLDGIAFITGITYQYENNKLNINIQLNKEAPSGMKGTQLTKGD